MSNLTKQLLLTAVFILGLAATQANAQQVVLIGNDLWIDGTSGNDTIAVYKSGTQVKVYLNGTTYTPGISPANLNSIGTTARAGDDWVSYVDVSSGNGFTLSGGTLSYGDSGTDTIWLSPLGGNTHYSFESVN